MKWIWTLLTLSLGMTLQAQGPIDRGQMMQFDGVDDCIDLGNFGGEFNRTVTAVTLETWVKFDTVEDATVTLIEQHGLTGTSYLSMETGSTFNKGKISVFVGNSYGRTPANFIVPNQWMHCAMVYDGTQLGNSGRLKLYVNGVEIPLTYGGWGNVPIPASINVNPDPFFIGAQRGTKHFPPVAMDEVRIWDVARTQAEIRENMHLTLVPNQQGLVAYYPFNKDGEVGTVGGVRDRSGHGHDGTAQNMAIGTGYVPSEVAVAEGVSERITVISTGPTVFTTPAVTLNFGDNPNGEVVVSRLQTESPTGGSHIAATVDNEYFVVYNFGTTPLARITGMTLNGITPLQAGTLNRDVRLHQRAANGFGPTWGSAVASASSTTPSPTGQIVFSSPTRPISGGQWVVAQTDNANIGVDQIAAYQGSEFHVFPNPAGEVVQVHWVQPLTLPMARLVVVDLQGQIIYTTSVTSEDTSLSLQDWATGVYTLLMVHEQGHVIAQQKLVVQ